MSHFRWIYVGFLSFFFMIVAGSGSGAEDLSLEHAGTRALTITSAQLTPNLVTSGTATDLILKIEIQHPFKAYLDRIQIRKKQDRYFSVGEIEVTPVLSFEDPVTKEKKFGAEGAVTLKAPAQMSRELESGTFHEKLILSYQLCTQKFCLFPSEKEFEVDFQNLTANAPSSVLTFTRIFFFFFAGFLAGLSPCLLPILPITALIIAQKTKSQSSIRRLLSLTVFILGLALSYSILGLIAGYSGALFGSQFSSPLFTFAVAVIFFVLALATLGVFEIGLPLAWQNRLQRLGSQSGFTGVFLMGFSGGLVASPCVSPVLVGLLGEVSREHDPIRGFFSFFVFSLGMGSVLLITGFFFEKIKKRLKTDFIQDLLGLALLATCFYYVSLGTGKFANFVCLSLFLVALWARLKRSVSFSNVSRIIWLLGFVTLEGIFLTRPPHTPPPIWRAETFREALESHKETIIDVRADWCSACRDLEAHTFTDTQIRAELENSNFLTFDATEPSEALRKFQEKYQIRGLPTVLFFDSDGHFRPDLTLTEFETADSFLKRLNQLK